MTKQTRGDELQRIPGVGPSIAKVLRELGIDQVSDLKNGEPEALYDQLCAMRGTRIDPCVLYVFRCAVYYANHTTHDAELLKWWNWKNVAQPVTRRPAPSAGSVGSGVLLDESDIN